MPPAVPLSYQPVLGFGADFICTSNSGNHVLAIDGYNLYISLNGGGLWRTLEIASGNYYDYCAISGDGQVFYVTTYYDIFRGTFVNNELVYSTHVY